MLANISIHNYSAVVLVLHNTYNKKNVDRLYFVTCTTVRITTVLHPAGVVYCCKGLLVQHTLDNRLLNMPIGMSIGWDIARRYLLTPSIGM